MGLLIIKGVRKFSVLGSQFSEKTPQMHADFSEQFRLIARALEVAISNLKSLLWPI